MKKTKEEVMEETENTLVDDAAIICIYDKVLNGQLKRFPQYTWELPNSLYYAKVITRYIFEEKLNWSIDDIKYQFKTAIIYKYKITGMHRTLFKSNFDLIDNAYPNEILPWELKQTPPKFWESDVNKKMALQWLFEGKLGGDLKNVSHNTFRQNGLYRLLSQFQNSPYQALEFMYPGKIKAWELGSVPNGFWNCDKNKREALKWLFEDIFNGDLTKITQTLSANTFKQYNLMRLLDHFSSSPYQTVNFYYPGKVKPWEMSITPNHFWTDEKNRKKALIWLFEEKMEGNLEMINQKTFQQYNLTSLLVKYFNNNMQKAIEFVYNDTTKKQPFEMSP